MILYNVILISTVLFTGLSAGLLYGYDCSVIKGLGALSGKEYLSAFQSINKAIRNPYFFVGFMGSLVLLPITTLLTFSGFSLDSFYLLVAATLVYFVGVFGVTLAGNVPLNNMLEQLDIPTASPASLAEMREKFEHRWNLLHHIRTYAAMLAFLLAIISIVISH